MCSRCRWHGPLLAAEFAGGDSEMRGKVEGHFGVSGPERRC